MKIQLNLILAAIIAIGRVFALPASAIRGKVGKSAAKRFAPLPVMLALVVGGCANPGPLCDGILASQIEGCRAHLTFYQYKAGESNFYAAKARCSRNAEGVRNSIVAQGQARASEIERREHQQELERQRAQQQHAQTQAIIGALDSGNRTYYPTAPGAYGGGGGGYAAGQAALQAGFRAMKAAEREMLSCLAELGWLRCTQGGQGRPECPN